MFGITFRKELTLLKKSLFRYLLADTDSRYTSASSLYYDLKVPLLLMTATCNQSLLGSLEKMIAVKVLPNNSVWAGQTRMSRRNILLSISFDR